MEPISSSTTSSSAVDQGDPRVLLLGRHELVQYTDQTIQSIHKTPVGTPPYGSTQAEQQSVVIRTYRWRWVVLAIFFLNLGANNSVWITIAPVADVMRCYYGISNTWVNTTTAVYMVTYVLLFLPCAWILDRYGLRVTMILASVTNALGTAVRVAGTGAEYFWVLLSGQTIASICNVFLWGAGSHLSEVWFPASERATSTAISATISPNFAEWSRNIRDQMFYYLLGQAVVCLVILFLTIIAFRDAPPSPPSISRQLETAAKHVPRSGCQQLRDFVFASLLSLKNIYFLLYVIASGIMFTMGGTVVSVLNEVIVPFFPGHDEQIGYIGLVIQTVTIISSLILSRLLDVTKAYYILNLFVNFSSAVSVAVMAVLILYQKNFYLLFVGAAFMGTFFSSVQAICYEFAVEMTYPLPEGVSAGLINFMSQILTIVMIFFVGVVSENPKHVSWGLWTIFATTALGALIAVFVKPELRRVKIDQTPVTAN